MKLLNLIQCLNLGGMEQSAYSLIRSTHGREIDWIVQSVTPAGEGIEKIDDMDVLVKDNKYIGLFGWRSHLALKEKVNSFTGDIILVTGPTLTSCAAIKNHRSKKILGVHFVHGKRRQDILKWKLFYRIFGNDYDTILYHSQYILEEAAVIAPYLKHKFRLIDYATHNCYVPSEQEREDARDALGIPRGYKVIGNAGWLIARKRFDIFLRTCQKVKKNNENVVFLIAGDGSLRSNLESLAASLGISQDVIFLGWQQNLENFYKSLDILLFNSDSDAFGRTVMEAMGYGIPSIASVIEGGPQSILVHNENGFIIDSHDTNKLSEYCLSLLQDQRLHQKFQLSSISQITQHCSQKRYIENYMLAFEEVLRKQADNCPYL